MALYKWVTGVITLLIGVVSPFITGDGAHPCSDNEPMSHSDCFMLRDPDFMAGMK